MRQLLFVLSMLGTVGCHSRQQNVIDPVEPQGVQVGSDVPINSDDHGFKSRHNYIPPNGVVPDEGTASKLAAIYLGMVYGEDHMHEQMPLSATLREGVWTVRGRWIGGDGAHGGVAEIEIAKDDGRMVRITHGK
jgi:hypothetical protein